MQRKFLIYLLALSQNLYFSQSIKDFNIPDSLKDRSFEQLEAFYNKINRTDGTKAELYANAILSKAKKEKNDAKIAYGYKYKGNYCYLKGEYPLALTYYLRAKEYTNSNTEIYHILNFNIGLLKLELKKQEEAIQLFLSYKNYLEKNKLTGSLNYLSCTYALAYANSQINKLEISDYYVKLGFKKELGVRNKEIKSYLLLVSGINAYKRKNNQSALKSLREASKLIRNHSYSPQNLAISEFYIGKILHNTNNKMFLNLFENVDSILIKTRGVTYELRDVYPLLIDYYKKSGDKEKQLLYIEHLLLIDSILNKNSNFLSIEINRKYDTPILLREKENLIANLNSKNNILFGLVGTAGLLLVAMSFLFLENRKKIKLYQNKASLLIQELDSAEAIDITPIKITDSQEKKNKITLPSDKFKGLSIQLEEFEYKKLFLDKRINLDTLSKEFNTNRAYLSKLVNELKGQNFPQYLNELRINYIIEELKKNKNLQKFTIAAIADEAGYNNVDSFTNAFKKITNTLPSYFIKALKEEEEEEDT
ncbi:helix-turn-helix domain-containing protein [Chryseobacterium rhizosphaerae]|uniref:helix-turn-helix domain-containing protein n=1 Tax=Chryseobacterium rhizosphaerae TaxID=395937 RepID=UPI002359EF68|nr:helix-turn-helix domain-containing protein [Chryseobacterium rhizosphaerae]MDC8099811.1 helix-turn-helix domain-containing protein [Chryseobacterium rhizosphaerae]